VQEIGITVSMLAFAPTSPDEERPHLMKLIRE